ncbi:uncharacterized protein [Euwallacea similis]|uniref:uncharacterized protein n=1 Tax=Euwallacea similis TaxID=1736056 RepID=UPI00344C9A25
MNQDINWFGGRRPDDREDQYGKHPPSQQNRRDQQQNPQQLKHRPPYREYQGRSQEREYNHSGRPQKRDVQLPNVWTDRMPHIQRSQPDHQLEVALAGTHPQIRHLDHYRRQSDLEPNNLRDPRSRSLSRNGSESEQDDLRDLRSRSLSRYVPSGYGPVMYPIIPYVGYVPYGQVVSGYSLPTYGYSGHTSTGYGPTPYRQDQPIQNEVIVTKQGQMVEELIMINSDDEEPMPPQQTPPMQQLPPAPLKQPPPMPPRQRCPIPMQPPPTQATKPPSNQPMQPPSTQPMHPPATQLMQPPPIQFLQPPPASPIEPPPPPDQYQQHPCLQYLQPNYGMMMPPEQKGMMYPYPPPPPVNWIPPPAYYQYDSYRASAPQKPSMRKIMYNVKVDDLLSHSKSLLDDPELLASIQGRAPKQKQAHLSSMCILDQTPSTLFENVDGQIPSTSSGFFQDSPSKWMYWDHEWSVCGRKPMCNCPKCPLPQISFRPFSEQVPPLQADLTEADDADEKNFDRTLSAEASFLEVVRRLRILFIRIVCPTRNVDNFIRDIEEITRLMSVHMYRANDPPSSSKFPEEGGSMHVMFYIFKLIQQIAFVLPYMGMERHSKVLDFYAAMGKLFLALLTFANHLMVNETNRKANFNSKVLAALILFPIIKCFHFRFDMMAHLLYDAPVDFRAKEQKGDEWQDGNEDKDPPPSLMAMFWRHIFMYMFEENYWLDPPYDEMLVLRLYVLMQKWLNYDGDHSVTCKYFKKFQKRFGTVRTLGRRFKSIGEILANRSARRRRGIAWGGDTPAMVRDYHRIRRNEVKKFGYFHRLTRCGEQMTSNQDKPESEQITRTISPELQGSTAEYYSELTSYVESPKQRRLRKGKFIPGKPHLCKGKMLPNPPVTDSMIEGQSADAEFLFSPTRLRGLSEPDPTTSSLSVYFPSITRPLTFFRPDCDPSTPPQSICSIYSEEELPLQDETDDMFPQSAEAFIEFICLEILIPVRDPQEDAKANAKKMDVPIIERISRPPSVIIEAIPYQQIEPFVFPIEPMEVPIGGRRAPQFERDEVVFVEEIEAMKTSNVAVDMPSEAEIQERRPIATDETLLRPMTAIIPFEGVYRPVEAIKSIPGIVEMPVESVGASSPTDSTGISTKLGETQSAELVESRSAGSASLEPVRIHSPEDATLVEAVHPHSSADSCSSTWTHQCYKLVHQRVCNIPIDTEITQTRSPEHRMSVESAQSHSTANPMLSQSERSHSSISTEWKRTRIFEDRMSNELAFPTEGRVSTESNQISTLEERLLNQPFHSPENRLSAEPFHSPKRSDRTSTVLKQTRASEDRMSNAVDMTICRLTEMTSTESSKSSPVRLETSQETESRQVPLLENLSSESVSRSDVLPKLRRFETMPRHLRKMFPGRQLPRSPCGWRHGERTRRNRRFSRPVRRYSRREISWRAARAITFKYSRMRIPPRAYFVEVESSEVAELTRSEGQLQDRPIPLASAGILDRFERTVSGAFGKGRRELQQIPGSSFMHTKSKSEEYKELKGSRMSLMEEKTEIGITSSEVMNSFKEDTKLTDGGKSMSDSSMENASSNKERRMSGTTETQASYNIKKMHVSRFLVDEMISSSDDALRKESSHASRYKNTEVVDEVIKSVETAVSTSDSSRDPLSRVQELLARRMHNNRSANAQERSKSRFKDEQMEQDLAVSNSNSSRELPYALQKIALCRPAESSSGQEEDLTMSSSSKPYSAQRRAASGPSGIRRSPSPLDQDLALSSTSNFSKSHLNASSRPSNLWNVSETTQQPTQMTESEGEPAPEERSSLAFNNEELDTACSGKPSSTASKIKRRRKRSKKTLSRLKQIISTKSSTMFEIPIEKYPEKRGKDKSRKRSESPDVVSTSRYSIRDDLKPPIKLIDIRSSRSGRKSGSEEVTFEGQISAEDFITAEGVSVSSSQVNQGKGLIVSLPRKDLVIPGISQLPRMGHLKQGRESDFDSRDISDQDNILPREDSNDESVSCVERAPQTSEDFLPGKKILTERSVQSRITVNLEENATEPSSDDGRVNSKPSRSTNPLPYETLDRKEVQRYFSKCKQFSRNGSYNLDSTSFTTSTSPLVTSSISSLSSMEMNRENLVSLRDPRLSGNSQRAKFYQHSCERKNVAMQQESASRAKPKGPLSCQDFYNSFGRQMSVGIIEEQDHDPIDPGLIESASPAEIENSIIVQCRFMHFVKEEPPEEAEEANSEDILLTPQWSLEQQNCVSAVSYKLQAMSLSGPKSCNPQMLKADVGPEKVAALMDFNGAEVVPESAQGLSSEAPSSVLRLSGPQSIRQASAKKTYSVTFCEQKMDEIYAREFGERNTELPKRRAFSDQSAYARSKTPALGLKPAHAIEEISDPFEEPRNLWDESRCGIINVKSDTQLQQSTHLTTVLKRPKSDNNNEVNNDQFESFKQPEPASRNSNLGKLVGEALHQPQSLDYSFNNLSGQLPVSKIYSNNSKIAREEDAEREEKILRSEEAPPLEEDYQGYLRLSRSYVEECRQHVPVESSAVMNKDNAFIGVYPDEPRSPLPKTRETPYLNHEVSLFEPSVTILAQRGKEVVANGELQRRLLDPAMTQLPPKKRRLLDDPINRISESTTKKLDDWNNIQEPLRDQKTAVLDKKELLDEIEMEHIREAYEREKKKLEEAEKSMNYPSKKQMSIADLSPPPLPPFRTLAERKVYPDTSNTPPMWATVEERSVYPKNNPPEMLPVTRLGDRRGVVYQWLGTPEVTDKRAYPDQKTQTWKMPEGRIFPETAGLHHPPEIWTETLNERKVYPEALVNNNSGDAALTERKVYSADWSQGTEKKVYPENNPPEIWGQEGTKPFPHQEPRGILTDTTPQMYNHEPLIYTDDRGGVVTVINSNVLNLYFREGPGNYPRCGGAQPYVLQPQYRDLSPNHEQPRVSVTVKTTLPSQQNGQTWGSPRKTEMLRSRGVKRPVKDEAAGDDPSVKRMRGRHRKLI